MTTKRAKMLNNGRCINGYPANQIINPIIWLWCYKQDKHGRYIRRDGKLLIDWNRSKWIHNSQFNKRYKRSAKTFNIPNGKPKVGIKNPNFLNYYKVLDTRSNLDKENTKLTIERNKQLLKSITKKNYGNF